ncbi:ATP-binding protein [Sphingomonas kaistensis]|uniref:ATP-binding protein n=1 Tax=Sphingomonas kaistensis TaxID=298708 RepID=A0ABZ2FZ92_9SPHN
MITDREIAFIKAMMARGMKTADIQFYFNHQDRPVNTGRFADIRAGRYGRSAVIGAATDEELQTFLDDHAAGRINVEIAKPDPLAPVTLRALFEKIGKGAWRLVGNETDRVECKETFHLRGNWLRAMAALANNQGGYILFGVRDNDVEGRQLVVVGMRDDILLKTDPLVLTRRIRSTFDPTPVFQIGKISFGNKVVGVMHVDQHPARPIVATKQDGDVAEGDIYYRYPGQSLKIKYSDLRTLLDERDARVRAELQPMLNRLVQLGPGRAMVADLSANELTDGRRSIRIDKELADKIAFIKEGHFVEKAGMPALRLVGEVRVGQGEPAVKKGIVNRAEMLSDFLDDTSRADPVDYLRFAIEISNGEWLPI